MKTEEGQPEVTALQSFVGRSGSPQMGRDPVNAVMVRHWRAAMGEEENDASTEVSIAPPAMLQVWTMPEPGTLVDRNDPITELFDYLDAQGFTGIVATNSEHDYLLPVQIGDRITSIKTISEISDVKKTGLGLGHFITSNVVFMNQKGETVGSQMHRVLKYRPPEKPGPAAQRPRPNVTLDTVFFFEGAAQGKLLIQGCQGCGNLHHPPTAACRDCGSLDLAPVEMSGRGTLFTYTVVHAPVSPPFVAPYPVILVELEEGPRVVSELHGVACEDIRIGMELEVDFIDLSPDFGLPIFRARRSNDG